MSGIILSTDHDSLPLTVMPFSAVTGMVRLEPFSLWKVTFQLRTVMPYGAGFVSVTLYCGRSNSVSV